MTAQFTQNPIITRTDEITISQSVDLADRRLQAIAKRVLKTLQLSAEKAVAHSAEPTIFPITADASAAEQIFLSRFKELNITKQRAAAIKALDSIKAPEKQRTDIYGDFAKIDLRSATSVEEQTKAVELPAALKFSVDDLVKLTSLHGQILVPDTSVSAAQVDEVAASDSSNASAQTTNKLELRIHSVKCLDETDPEFGGDDEISLSGLTIDESGDTGKVAPFVVRDDFDDNEIQVYSPPKRFVVFNLTEGTTFPKSYFVQLILAEIDMGVFGGFLNKLWEKVKAKVLEEIKKAVGGAVDTTIPGLGVIVGAVAAWVVDNVIQWLIDLFNDDVFNPITVSVNIPSLNARWNGKTDSPEKVITYSGYGGKYQLVYDWRVFA